MSMSMQLFLLSWGIYWHQYGPGLTTPLRHRSQFDDGLPRFVSKQGVL